ncbi:MAG TPA: hypothetical protein VMH22_02195 [bacterium]|nr:hypothetical protein [bacterium]
MSLKVDKDRDVLCLRLDEVVAVESKAAQSGAAQEPDHVSLPVRRPCVRPFSVACRVPECRAG